MYLLVGIGPIHKNSTATKNTMLRPKIFDLRENVFFSFLTEV